jgi:AraC-like DNA-binding protein
MKTAPALDFTFDTDAFEAPASAHVQELVSFDTPEKIDMCFHTHKRGQLAFAIGGACLCYTPTAVWTVMPNQAFWLPAGLPHRMFHTEGASSGYLYLDNTVFPAFEGMCSVSLPLYTLYGLMHLAEAEPDKAFYGHNAKLFSVIIEEILAQKAEPLMTLPLPKDERLLYVYRFMNEHPAERRTLEDWADFFHVSGKTFSRLVKSEIGVSFPQWVNRIQVLAAIQLLSHDRDVSWIAYELGFNSPNAFSTMFKRQVGMSPQMYRRLSLNRK